MNKTKTHTVYKDESGTRLVGVTTVVGLLNKPALVGWANKLGLNGIESSKYVDDLATVGTLAHAMVQSHFTKEKVDLSEYSPKDIDRAENAVLSFFEWAKGKKIEPIFNEKQLVCGPLKFGGTCDMYAKIDGVKTLVDFKTSGAIYDEHLIQLAGYYSLIEYNGWLMDKAIIVRIGRDKSEGFEVRELVDIDKYKEIFRHLLSIYYLLKK